MSFYLVISMFLKRYKINLIKRYSNVPPVDQRIVPVNLAYSSYENQNATNAPPLLIIPGYLASHRNWTSTCKRLLGILKPQRKIIAVDLRNHGDSPHTKEHTNEHVIADLKFFIESYQIKSVAVLGHSYGGMMGMLMSLMYPDLVERLIVEEIAPTDQRKLFEDVKRSLDAAANISVPPKVPMSVARTLVDQQLAKVIKDDLVRGFLLTQLVQKSNGKYSWRFNMKVLREFVMNCSILPDIQGKMYENPVIFIGGTKSTVLRKSKEIDIKKYFPFAEFHYVEGAGHNVHIDKLLEFCKICTEFLNKQL